MFVIVVLDCKTNEMKDIKIVHYLPRLNSSVCSRDKSILELRTMNITNTRTCIFSRFPFVNLLEKKYSEVFNTQISNQSG